MKRKQTSSVLAGEDEYVKDNLDSFRYLKQIQSCGGSPTIWPFSYIMCELKVLSYICLIMCFSRTCGLHVLR